MMNDINYKFWILVVLLFSILYLLSERPVKKLFKIYPAKVSYENSKSALEKISAWATWLTGIQTAAMASMALLTNGKVLTDVQKNYGFFILLFFGSSIILSTWRLSSIPSIQQRLTNSETLEEENDIYEKNIYSFIPLAIKITLGRYSGLVHTYFLIGIVFYGVFIFSLFK